MWGNTDLKCNTKQMDNFLMISLNTLRLLYVYIRIKNNDCLYYCTSVYVLVNRTSSSSVYSPFSDRVGLPPHNTPFLRGLMKSIGAAFYDRMPFLTCGCGVGCSIK